MRKWRPTDVEGDKEWAVKYHIVIPKKYLEEVIKHSHDTPMAGHPSVNKSHDKSNFSFLLARNEERYS